jgi:hypothetical protein
MATLDKRGHNWYLETATGWRTYRGGSGWSEVTDNPPPPPQGRWEKAVYYLSSGGLGVLLVGLFAIFISALLGWVLFGHEFDSTIRFLGYVAPLIGAFTGHAAGHSAAASRESRRS